jgi:hypothetical protein
MDVADVLIQRLRFTGTLPYTVWTIIHDPEVVSISGFVKEKPENP